MKNKTKKVALSEPNHTTTTAEACIFTPADRKRLRPLLSEDSFDQLMKLHVEDPMPNLLVDSAGEEIDMLSPISIKWWNDGNEQYIYQIGKTVYAYYDEHDRFLVYLEADVTSVIEHNYPREEGYLEEKCVEFEVKPPLILAKRTYLGSCRVWINTFYRDAHLRAADRSG